MKNINTTNHILFLALIILGLSACQEKKKTLFDKIPSSQSQISFNNQITENDTMNILDYEYIYNGGGVGIGDFNNDGLEDIYFTGNMVESKMYLNKGEFKFEDITSAAGVANEEKWSGGVSVIDINNDGLLDIYVCNSTFKGEKERENTLYIHQGLDANGIPTFKNMAEEYGLNDNSYSVNSAFFDYDNDGDLDVLIVVNEFKGYAKYANVAQTQEKRKKFYQRIDRLYRNDFDETLGHSVFTNVSDEAGIDIAGFSLAINISDINKDGWKDIYISNDFQSNDILYINQKDGTFKNEEKKYLKHTCHSAMGNDIADINNDGYPEIVALDMLPENNYRQKKFLKENNYTNYFNNNRFGYTYQYVRNVLQLNNGIDENHSPKFSEISLYAGVSATDWSWTPLMVDFDNDLNRDLIITNGFPRDVTDLDFANYRIMNQRFAADSLLLSQVPSFKSRNIAFQNNGDLTFSDVGKDWGLMETTFSNGAAYADFDNDGDIDWVVNNIDDEAFLYKNNAIELQPEHHYLQIKLEGTDKNIDAFGATVMLELDDQELFHEHSPYRGYLSTYTQTIHFGLGTVKTIPTVRIIWQDGQETQLKNVATNQVLTVKYKESKKAPTKSLTPTVSLFQKDETLSLTHLDYDFIDFNIQPLLLHKLSQYGPSVSVGDINQDGTEDLYIGGAAMTSGYFVIQNPDGSVQIDTFKGNPVRAEEMGTLLFDADGDNDNDLFIVNGSYEFDKEDTLIWDRYFENRDGKFVYQPNALPKYFNSGSCVKAADFDQDGDLDLFVGGRVISGDYPLPTNSYLLENVSKNGKTRFEIANKKYIPELTTFGLTSDALWTDFNNDGWMDLMIACEFKPIQFFENQQGTFKKVSPAGTEQQGFWNSITGADLDGDGDIDYVLGNIGENIYNTVSKEYPFRLYVNDFDNNGNSDALPFAYFKNQKGELKQYPFMFRNDLFKEVNPARKTFPSFESYANASLDNIITKETQAKTDIYEVNYISNSILWNEGDGNWKMEALPNRAQLGPVYGALCEDFDQDGQLDILLVGNDYGNEIFFGRLDALNGLLLTGQSNQQFAPVPVNESGFYVPEDGKSLVRWQRPNGSTIIAGQNNAAFKIFKRPDASQYFTPQPNDRKVILSDGSHQELYYGNGFLSQGSRTVALPKGVTVSEVIDFKGNKRKQ